MGFCHVDVMQAEIVPFLFLSIFLYEWRSERLNSSKAIVCMSISEKNVRKDSRVYPRFPPTVWCLNFTVV